MERMHSQSEENPGSEKISRLEKLERLARTAALLSLGYAAGRIQGIIAEKKGAEMPSSNIEAVSSGEERELKELGGHFAWAFGLDEKPSPDSPLVERLNENTWIGGGYMSGNEGGPASRQHFNPKFSEWLAKTDPQFAEDLLLRESGSNALFTERGFELRATFALQSGVSNKDIIVQEKLEGKEDQLFRKWEKGIRDISEKYEK